MVTPDSSLTTLTVSQLNRQARQLLEMHLNQVWVEGELSNLATPSSGHWYFTLKDDQAQIRCAMFSSQNRRIKQRPKEGALIRVRARVSIYEGRGDYQLIVEHLEDAGIGKLQQAFEALKKKLASEGLFNEEFKQELPEYPQSIGVITSATGAAIHDIVTVLERRYPLATITILPVAVQGKGAAEEIAAAIARANHASSTEGLIPFDALIVGRGGGSLEDLWAFNEEVVARAIFSSEIPIVSAVGHEIDFSIADFVADLRAPTPSAAAEMLTPDGEELANLFQSYRYTLCQLAKQNNKHYQQQLQVLRSGLRHPGQILQEQNQHLDHLEIRLQQSLLIGSGQWRQQLTEITSRLQQQSPLEMMKRLTQKLQQLQKQSQDSIKYRMEQKQQQIRSLSQLLHGVSPLKTLNRGYSIVRDKNGKVVQRSDKLKTGEKINAQLKEGSIDCEIIEIKPGN